MDDEQIDKLLAQLYEYALNYDGHEYGLPVYDIEQMQVMREIVRKWAKDELGADTFG